MSKIKFSYLMIAVLLMSVQGFAAKYGRSSSSSSSSDYSSSGKAKMLTDLQMQYVRDTKPTGRTDTLGKLSVGGLFSSWVGLDLFGIMAAKTHDTMLGLDIRLMPTEWFYLKGGYGAYSDKLTRELKATPIVGAGIIANMSDGLYFVSEFGYFEKGESRNVSFGAGLGMYF